MISEPSNDKRKPRRNIAFYYVIALLILILLNALLFPSLMQRQVPRSATTPSSACSRKAGCRR